MFVSKALFFASALALTGRVTAWTPSTSTPNGPNAVSRRQAFQQALTASVVATTAASTSFMAFPGTAMAIPTEETPRVVTRQGGLLEAFQDGPRSLRLMVPTGWNKFEGEVGAYDLKWQDLVDPAENIKISSTPVKSTTESVAVLGDVQELGKNLASKRNAKLIKATERMTDGVLFYKFDFAINDGTHQLLQMCIGKGKLWSLDASAKEKRWDKREELYNNVAGSFMPKLNDGVSM
jgi:photosystem II oxygen-evolving enhancer protein 2